MFLDFLKNPQKEEVRASLFEIEEALISLCAMLNAFGEGTIYFGLVDKSDNVGLIPLNDELDYLETFIEKRISPLPDINLKWVNIESRNVLKVILSGNKAPYFCGSFAFYREGSKNLKISPIELNSLLLKRYKGSNSEQVLPFIPSRIDQKSLIRFLRKAFYLGRIDFLYESLEASLQKLGLITKEGWAYPEAYLCFGKEGFVKLIEVLYQSKDRDRNIYKEMSLNIFDALIEAFSFVSLELSCFDYLEKNESEDKSRIIEEILINAFLYSDFKKEIPFKLSADPSQMELHYPCVISSLTNIAGEANFKYPILASLLYLGGYIDAIDEGYEAVETIFRNNYSRLRKREDETGTTITLINKNGSHSKNKGDLQGNLKNKEAIIQNTWLKEGEIALLKALKKNPKLTVPKLIKIIHKSEAFINRYLASLTKKHLLKREGSRKSGTWVALISEDFN